MNSYDIDGAKRNLSALVDFSNFINSSLDLKFILSNLLLTCFGKFHTTKGLVALVDEDNKLRVKAFKGFTQAMADEFPDALLCGECFTSKGLEAFCEKFHIAYSQNIVCSQGVKGAIFLGERLNKKEYSPDDKEFVGTLVNIAATAIENSTFVEKLKDLNRSLDSKVSMLSSLFELSKEFSGIFDPSRVGKLLVYSVIGQLLVSNYAVVLCSPEGLQVLEANFPKKLLETLKVCNANEVTSALRKSEFTEELLPLATLGVELIIPMQIQGETKGLILLGKRFNKEEFKESDIEFIYATGSLAIISIENAKLFKEALEKQRMEEDLEIARDIQKNLFPQKIPKLKSFEISAINVSSKQVGGDYYDVIKLAENDYLIAIGDVSGKGVPAALLMANLQAFLKSICRQGLELNKATDMINDLISENTAMGNFITFFWGVLNDETKSLTYVNAGHNPPLLVRNGEIRKLTKGGMILGVLKTVVPYISETVSLEAGDTLILFTDGVTEAMNKNMEEFTDEKLEHLAAGLKNETAGEILQKIRAEVETFVNGANQSDDITLLTVKVKP
ncbi:MAG: SpoIIE family protein phosphatase [Ignavibacteria bacterium]|jgi:sigma-B regulation protein RsbU (phosphoserine phosphatase)|nr:SpoIIE family protein phosphatase [Ignavibacteria bacterium]MCU7500700.1 SpoIIE family protein phosphatase [Ignavibacteria bacterium]MCU7511307.1 SpoIIE family protein phosphatase [Ignavibacteria bacterium]MCU7518971.1 SpoIIE family protein phosphatase [Ignavibacteria bacterium]MCU7523252.1 SpoIIE family protein phosphatase [Ignavibacteria bacterium]